MVQLRDHPYIWATWLPRLLTGDRSCEWAIWFKARYQGWTRQPKGFDQSQWLLDHTALLNQTKAEWEERGYVVYVEAQNSFRLRGRTATLAGRPDLIVDRDDDALIIDVKTGQEQPWHTVQLQIYQYALPNSAARALPTRQAGRRGRLSLPHRPRAPGRTVWSVHRPARRNHPPPRGIRSAEARPERPRVPLLRHHRR